MAFEEEEVQSFHDPESSGQQQSQQTGPAASTSSSRSREPSRPPIVRDSSDRAAIFQEVAQRALERNAKKQDQLDKLQDLVFELASQVQNNEQEDQTYEEEDEEEDFNADEEEYTEEGWTRGYAEAQYVEQVAEVYTEMRDPDHQYTAEEWQQWLDA